MSQRDEGELRSSQRRVAYAALMLAGVFVVGVVGYRVIGGSRHDWLDAVYMTTVVLTTTGLREVVPTESTGGEIFTTLLLLFGATAAVYTLSMITAFIVEGDLTKGFRRRRMQKRIDAMQGHYIICGAGQTGTSVIRELTSTDRECVAIEHNQQHLAVLEGSFPSVAALHGDCSDDETLTLAGVQRAAGIVVCTDDDKNALVTTVLARQLNPLIRVIARATSDKAASRLRQAGADGVVSPAQIGGMRLASELIRPTVVGFLDQMLRDTNRNLRLEDIPVTRGSPLAGQEVSALKLHEYGTGLLLLAMRTHDGAYLFNPPAATRRVARQSPDRDGRSRVGAGPSSRRLAGGRYGLLTGAGGSGAGASGAAPGCCAGARPSPPSRRGERSSWNSARIMSRASESVAAGVWLTGSGPSVSTCTRDCDLRSNSVTIQRTESGPAGRPEIAAARSEFIARMTTSGLRVRWSTACAESWFASTNRGRMPRRRRRASMSFEPAACSSGCWRSGRGSATTTRRAAPMLRTKIESMCARVIREKSGITGAAAAGIPGGDGAEAGGWSFCSESSTDRSTSARMSCDRGGIDLDRLRCGGGAVGHASLDGARDRERIVVRQRRRRARRGGLAAAASRGAACPAARARSQ